MWKFGRYNFSHWRVITYRIFTTIVSLCFKMGDMTGFVRLGHICPLKSWNASITIRCLFTPENNNQWTMLSIYFINYSHTTQMEELTRSEHQESYEVHVVYAWFKCMAVEIALRWFTMGVINKYRGVVLSIIVFQF